MKSVMMLCLMALSLNSVSANQLTCEQLEGDTTQGLKVLAIITADIEVKSPVQVELTNLETSYDIFDDYGGNAVEAYLWSRGNDREESVVNSPNYRPRVYKNHMQFSYKVSDRSNRSFGWLDLIVPTDKITANVQGSTFTSYLIMTYMDDHFGGTISLNCTID